jgi:hypothetical protein
MFEPFEFEFTSLHFHINLSQWTKFQTLLLCYLGGPVDIIRNWVRLQGASAQQERVILAALDSNYLAKLPKPRKWRNVTTIPRNRAFRSRYYQQVAHILGWKERHVGGFSEVVRDTWRNVVWPDHGEEHGDMAVDYPQRIGGERSSHIDVTMERSAMVKGGEGHNEEAQVINQEGRIKNNNKDTSHLHKMMVRGEKTSGREIEACCEEGERRDGDDCIGTKKRARTKEEGGGSSRVATKSEGTTRRVLLKWRQ